MQPPPTLAARFHALTHRPHDPRAHLRLTPGRYDDYRQLAEFHYRAPRPATMTRILTWRDPTPTPAHRFTRPPEKAPTPKPSPRQSRNPDTRGRPVAVLIESMPHLSCALRNLAIPGRYAAPMPPADRARLLNAEIRTISRVVVHPQYRGLGLAHRLVRHALDTATTPYTEALAAMGRVNPFFTRAGMTAYHRPPLPGDQRLIAALQRLDLHAADLANPTALAARIHNLPANHQAWITRELQRWHRHNAGRRATRKPNPPGQPHHPPDLTNLLTTARDRLFVEPVYFLHDNRQ